MLSPMTARIFHWGFVLTDRAAKARCRKSWGWFGRKRYSCHASSCERTGRGGRGQFRSRPAARMRSSGQADGWKRARAAWPHGRTVGRNHRKHRRRDDRAVYAVIGRRAAGREHRLRHVLGREEPLGRRATGARRSGIRFLGGDRALGPARGGAQGHCGNLRQATRIRSRFAIGYGRGCKHWRCRSRSPSRNRRISTGMAGKFLRVRPERAG